MSPSRLVLVLLFGATAILLAEPRASAHGMRSAYVELEELADNTVVARVRTTVDAPSFAYRLDDCERVQGGSSQLTDSGIVRSAILQCEGPLAGRRLELVGLGDEIEEATVWVRLADATLVTALVLPGSPTVVIPGEQSFVDGLSEYFGLGIAHIAGGLDHLLFLTLLVLYLRRAKPVFLAETAFSLSHGLAFAATALGLVRVSPGAAEACIALSLMLFALDVGVRGTRPQTRSVAVLALIFGVVHGLGFAGGLQELGVPADNAASALVGFGLGVEVGQLLFVALLLGLLRVASQFKWARWPELGVVYASGGLAAYWLLERTSALFTTENWI